MAESDESPQFSITLPLDAIEMIEHGLRPFGLYGKKRATICRSLILDALKTSAVRDQIKEGKEKALKRQNEPPPGPSAPVGTDDRI